MLQMANWTRLRVDIVESLAMIKINGQSLVEENTFIEPENLPWVKALTTLLVIIIFVCGFILLRISFFERLGYLGPYRTLINQLVASLNLLVS